MLADGGPPRAGTGSARLRPENPRAKHDTDALMTSFPGRVGVQQRGLTTYRVPFVGRLAAECAGGPEVFASEPRAREGIAVAGPCRWRGTFASAVCKDQEDGFRCMFRTCGSQMR